MLNCLLGALTVVCIGAGIFRFALAESTLETIEGLVLVFLALALVYVSALPG